MQRLMNVVVMIQVVLFDEFDEKDFQLLWDDDDAVED